MKYEVTVREVSVRLDDDARKPPLTGTTSSLRPRTITPVSGIFRFLPNGEVRAEFSGPTVRSDGSVGAAYFTVKVQVYGRTTYVAAPEWVVEMAEQVRTS